MLLKKTCKRLSKLGHKGAFLIEALLCVVIMAVCLMTIIQGLFSGLRAAVESENYYRAVLAGENAIFAFMRTVNSKAPLKDMKLEEINGYQVALTLSSAEKLDSSKSLQQAVIDVQWKSRNKDRKISFSSLILGRLE